MYFGMLGLLVFLEVMFVLGVYDYFDLYIDCGLLWLIDLCCFGVVVWVVVLEVELVVILFGGLGLEFFDECFDGLYLYVVLSGWRVVIK